MTAIALPGQATLIESWRALAGTSRGAHVRETSTSVAAVFPAWDPLNNAIARVAATDAGATAAEVMRLDAVYARAGVASWSYWVPSPARDLDAKDAAAIAIAGVERDCTTLVMRADLPAGLASHDAVRATSISAAASAGDEPIAMADLDDPAEGAGLDAWVLTTDGFAVAGLWACVHDGDCGIYAVGTAPAWRRRGFAHALVEHALAAARGRGARTASLQSTPEAVSLYASLGFTAVGRYEEWLVTPAAR